MLNRIKEAIRIIRYREPENGPDIVVKEADVKRLSCTGVVIAGTIEIFLVAYVIGLTASNVVEKIFKIFPKSPSISITTITGVVAVLLVGILHSIRNDVENKIRARLNLKDILAPYFGHRLENAIRILKG